MRFGIWIRAVWEQLRSRSGHDVERLPEPVKHLPLSPSDAQAPLFAAAPLRLARTKAHPQDLEAWQSAARKKLSSLLRLSGPGRRCEIMEAEPTVLDKRVRRRTVYLSVDSGRCVPVTILIARDRPTAPAPTLLYQAGSASGVHLAWGEARRAIDMRRIEETGADMGTQAALVGWTVVCVEQFGYGDRRERKRLPLTPGLQTGDAFTVGTLLGRSLVGERVADLCATIDWLVSGADGIEEFECTDITRLALLGHSSGGTTSVYAAAVDTRIRACIASGCLGFIRDTLTTRRTGEGDAIVPNILEWMEMDDVVSLIAPRIFLVVSGKDDHIWPISGARAVLDSAGPVWEALGSPEAFAWAAGAGGHRPYPRETWELAAQKIKWGPAT